MSSKKFKIRLFVYVNPLKQEGRVALPLALKILLKLFAAYYRNGLTTPEAVKAQLYDFLLNKFLLFKQSNNLFMKSM